MVIEDVFAVIAEQTRRDILASLGEGDKAVGQLVEELGASQPTVSKHLRVLREAQLVSMRAQGQQRFYSLNPGPLRSVHAWLESFDGVVAASPDTGAALGSATPPDTGSDDAPVPVPGPGVPEPAHPRGAAVVPATAPDLRPGDDGSVPQHIGRTVGRAAKGAADLLANLPKFGRRRD
ncbi:MAG: ArsR/SmtB family transcription factor [Actinomycetales bacterium]|jgi:DNA-binding transcriptional ArsR family regulator